MPASAQRLPPPLSPDQAEALARLTEGLEAPRLWWLSGYVAGLAGRLPMPGADAGIEPAAVAPPAATLSIVYGSQTGNARRVAETLAGQCEAAGLRARVLRADAYPLRELKDERYLYLVVSTQGDGDPSDDARALVDFLASKRAPALKQLQFAVLGLGDSSYPQFCAIGRQLDARLAELGGTRLQPRGDADLDIETVAVPWLQSALAAARHAHEATSQQPLASARLDNVTPLRPVATSPSPWTRETPFAARLLGNQRLTIGDDSNDIRHLELSLEASGLAYVPGDALGVWPVNPPALVAGVLETLRLDGEQVVEQAGQSLPLRQWLGEKRELTRLARPFLASHAALAHDRVLDRMLTGDDPAPLAALLANTQLIDLLRSHPAGWSAEALVATLRPLAPRLYSIASSMTVVGEEAHLAVAHVHYEVAGETRWGAASGFLARAAEDDRLPVFIERNDRFRLPADPARDIVMIGPGTGVAPFRGFVQERAATGASGRNWLLFGNRRSRGDFLYQLEWQQALKGGALHRLDLAFSRDVAKTPPPHVCGGAASMPQAKAYVQHRLREHGRALFDWLENGAHLYVCGAIAMGRDVHAALLEVIGRHGGRDADGANDYLNELARQGRYARDVY